MPEQRSGLPSPSERSCEGGSEAVSPPATEPASTTPAAQATALALRRLLPLLVLMHVIAYADRINITFAETELERDLGLSATVFGLAAGIFFLSYVVLEVPSNLLLHRIGARVWMARIMITWGLVAAAGALAWDGPSLIVQRFLLGVAEAGFFPGIVYLIACWFPAAERARATAIFMLGVVIAAIIGGPVSSGLLALDGVAGLDGWQWLFAGEGVPAILTGLWVLRALPDRPSDARWLSAEQATALEAAVAAEAPPDPAAHARFSVRRTLADRRVRLLATVYTTINLAAYGTIFWLADIVERAGIDGADVGLVAAIPFALGASGLVVLGRRSSRTGDSRGTLVLGLALGVCGLVGTALLPAVPAILAGGLAAFGMLGAIPAFWSITQSLFAGRTAAGCLALVNAIGVTGGLVGPVIVGALKDATDSLTPGLLVLAAVLAAGALLAQRAPAPKASPAAMLASSDSARSEGLPGSAW